MQKKVLYLKVMLHLACILKINNTFIDNTEDLDIVMPMYNLLENSNNYLITSESFWNYYRDEVYNINDNSSDAKSFKYKTKIKGKTEVIEIMETPTDHQEIHYQPYM